MTSLFSTGLGTGFSTAGIVGTTAVTTLTSGLPVFSVLSFDAVGDGTTDDTAAIQRAIDAAYAAGGGIVHFPAQLAITTWRISTRLRLYAGVILQGSGYATVLALDDVSDPGGQGGIYCTTTVAATPALSADVTEGARSVTVASTSGISVGMSVLIQDDNSLTLGAPSGSYSYNNGMFITTVTAIVGSVLSVQDAIPMAFTASLGGKVTAFTPVVAPGLRDLTVRTSGTPTARIWPVSLTYAQDALLERVQVDGWAYSGGNGAGARLSYCSTPIVRDCTFKNGQSSGGSGTAGLSLLDCTAADVQGCTVANSAFGIVATGSPLTQITGCRVSGRVTSGSGRGIKVQAGSHFSVISGNTVRDPGLYGIAAFDSNHTTISGNTVFHNGYTAASVADTTEAGIHVGGYITASGHHCTVTGNSIALPAGHGILFAPASPTTANEYFTVISGNTIRGAQYGILVYGSSNAIIGNTVDDWGTGAGIALWHETKHCQVIGNILHGSSGYSIDSTTGSNSGDNTIAFNYSNRSGNYKTTDTVVTAASGLLTVAGSVAVGTAKVLSGTGSPESVVAAGIGALYLRTDGGTSTSLYVKESGASTTGWIAK